MSERLRAQSLTRSGWPCRPSNGRTPAACRVSGRQAFWREMLTAEGEPLFDGFRHWRHVRHQLDDRLHPFVEIGIGTPKTAASATLGLVNRRFSHPCCRARNGECSGGAAEPAPSVARGRAWGSREARPQLGALPFALSRVDVAARLASENIPRRCNASAPFDVFTISGG
jgi:hypothetical protein